MSTPRSRHLVVMAAGTGGHIVPGLAVAAQMQRRGWTVSWMGTPAGMEHRLVPPAGLPLDSVNFTGMRGNGWRHSVTGAGRMAQALWQAQGILRRRGAHAVLGMGGYVCIPGGLAAAVLGKPLVLMNADAAPLLSTRALSGLAKRICFGFDGPAVRAMRRALVTGNPVRASVEALPAPAERYAGRSGPMRVLVVGGSLGARVLNQTVPQALAAMAPSERPQVVHQTGQAHLDSVQADYARLGVQAQLLPFIDDMPAQLAACDVVLCRAGAITVSELCAAGVPSLLVPLVISTTAHQRDNALWMASHGAARHLPQDELSPARLADEWRALDRRALQTMAEQARALARPAAAERVADEIERLVAA